MTERKKGITGTTLKMIAIVAMFIDHVAAILLSAIYVSMIPVFHSSQESEQWFAQNGSVEMIYDLYNAMRGIGRFGFPLFAFLIVEGFQHTRSVIKYALRLGIFALLSELPFNLGLTSVLFFPYYQNVFFTLLLGLLCLVCMHYVGEEKKDCKKLGFLFYPAALLAGPFVTYMVLHDFSVSTLFPQIVRDNLWIAVGASAAVSVAIFVILGRKWDLARRNAFSGMILSTVLFCALGDLLRTDYGAGGVLSIAILYVLRGNRILAFFVACAELTMLSKSEFMAFLMLIPIALYNGERGMKINKYFFYAFYPVHLGLLYLLTLLLGYTTFTIK